MSLMNEYIDFLNDLLNPFKNTTKGECKSLIVSSSVQKASNASISKIINKSTTNVDQKSFVNNKITVDCGPLSDDPFYLQFKEVKYDSSGKPIKGTGCPMFGCCYDVLQSSRINLKSINKNITKHTEDMVNTVSQTIKKSVDMTLGPHSNCSKFLDQSIAETKQLSINEVNNILNKELKQDYVGTQEIKIESNQPLLCHNKCNEQPTAGNITQALNVDMVSKNITSTITKNIQKNYIKQVTKSKTKMTEVSQQKIIVFSIATVALFIVLYIISYYLLKLVLCKIPWIPPVFTPSIYCETAELKFGNNFYIVGGFVLLIINIELFLKTAICSYKNGLDMKCIPIANLFMD